jgi:hypothetical protein
MSRINAKVGGSVADCSGQSTKVSEFLLMVKSKLVVFDTTLRDGEQSPGVTLTVNEKVEIAKQLSRLGVDVCEAVSLQI